MSELELKIEKLIKEQILITESEAQDLAHLICELPEIKGGRVGAEVIVKTAEENKKLKEALAKAMFNRNWVIEKCTNYDPSAGSDYEIDFTEEMKEWAKLCDVDIDKKDPTWYWRK